MTKKINILEINNFDIYGKHFNGYSIQKYINAHPQYNFTANLIVNHKLGHSDHVIPLYANDSLTNYDWQIENIEKTLGIKNQISIAETALINNPFYKNADILHFHMYHNCSLPIEFLTRIPPQKKIIVDLHDTYWMTDNNIPMLEVFSHADGKYKKSLDAQRKRVLNSIDAVFVVHSPYMLQKVRQSSATKKLCIHLISFGINTSIFKPLPNNSKLRKRFHIPQKNLVLMCRAQKEFKGIVYIEKALQALNAKQPITIITIGAKNSLASVKDKYQIIEFDMIDSEKEMAKLYNICDIFLAPSTEESFGSMAVEAMSCEKPVIVFDGTALPDTTHAPTIGISTKRSSEELSKAILYLIKHPEDRSKRGRAGRRYVLDHYTEKQYFDGYLELFNSLSKVNKRSIQEPPLDTAPANLKKINEFLSGKTKSIGSIDFNNSFVQKEIQKYNNNLYNEIKASGNKITPKNLAKKIIPTTAKHQLNKLRRKISCLKNKIYH